MSCCSIYITKNIYYTTRTYKTYANNIEEKKEKWTKKILLRTCYLILALPEIQKIIKEEKKKKSSRPPPAPQAIFNSPHVLYGFRYTASNPLF